MADLRPALRYLFRVEPGATAERAVERVDDATSVGQVQAVTRQMVRDGVLEVRGAGWATVPDPDPTEKSERLLDVLRAVVDEPNPAEKNRIAQDALDEASVGG